MGLWLGNNFMEDRDPETIVIEIKTDWINKVKDLIGRDDTEIYLTSLYSHELFDQEIRGNDQGLYEQELENKIGTVKFNKLKEFMEENYPLVWRGHDTFIGDTNTDFNAFMLDKGYENVWLPLEEKFDGNIKDLIPGNWFMDGDATIVGHNSYQLNDDSDWDEDWYVPKGLYEIKYLKDLDIVITDQQAINYQLLKL